MREERREEDEAALWHLMVFKLYSSIFMFSGSWLKIYRPIKNTWNKYKMDFFVCIILQAPSKQPTNFEPTLSTTLHTHIAPPLLKVNMLSRYYFQFVILAVSLPVISSFSPVQTQPLGGRPMTFTPSLSAVKTASPEGSTSARLKRTTAFTDWAKANDIK